MSTDHLKDPKLSKADNISHNRAAFDVPHRRKSHPLNTPCLVQHLIRWHEPVTQLPRSNGLERKYRHPTTKDIIINAGEDKPIQYANLCINNYLDCILKNTKRIRENHDLRFTDNRELADYSESERRRRVSNPTHPNVVFTDNTLATSSDLGGIYFELLADVYKEYHTVTFRVFPLLNDVENWDSNIRNISEFIRAAEALKILSNNKTPKSSMPSNAAIDDVFASFWDKFFQQFNDTSIDGRKHLFGETEAVFRGLILRNTALNLQKKIHRIGPSLYEADESLPDRKIVNLIHDAEHDFEYLTDGLPDVVDVDDEDAFRSLRGYLNEHYWFFSKFFGYGEKDTWIQNFRPTNAVLSGLANGIAIYGSDLGAHSPADGEFPHRETRFFIVYGGNSRDHLGRMLRRLLFCAETRIAAAKRMTSLRALDQKLAGLRKEYDELNTKNFSDDIIESFRQSLGKLDRDLQKGAFSGHGVKYSVSRTNFYFRNLRNFIEGLREVRIAGWQTYGDFILARYFAAEDSISSIEEEFDALLMSRERAERRLMVAESKSISVENQKSISALNIGIRRIYRIQKAQESGAFALGLLAFSVGYLAFGEAINVLFGDGRGFESFGIGQWVYFVLFMIAAIGLGCVLFLIGLRYVWWWVKKPNRRGKRDGLLTRLRSFFEERP